jgi:hypothetical protein
MYLPALYICCLLSPLAHFQDRMQCNAHAATHPVRRRPVQHRPHPSPLLPSHPPPIVQATLRCHPLQAVHNCTRLASPPRRIANCLYACKPSRGPRRRTPTLVRLRGLANKCSRKRTPKTKQLAEKHIPFGKRARLREPVQCLLPSCTPRPARLPRMNAREGIRPATFHQTLECPSTFDPRASWAGQSSRPNRG